jgi:hypothetical protein
MTFLEVTTNGKPISIRLDTIMTFYPHHVPYAEPQGTVIHRYVYGEQSQLVVDEDYSVVKDRINADT